MEDRDMDSLLRSMDRRIAGAETDYHRPLADMKRRLNLERPATSARSNRPWVYGLMSAAAVLLLIFGATLFFKKTITDAVSPEETLVAHYSYTFGSL